MASETTIQLVSNHLFADEEAKVYAVLDGASVKDLLARFDEHQPERVCLYRGELAPDMAVVAPYLVRLEDETEFADWVIGKGWGAHWGVFAVAHADLDAMRRHLRRLLTVYSPEGKPMLFRYVQRRRTRQAVRAGGELRVRGRRRGRGAQVPARRGRVEDREVAGQIRRDKNDADRASRQNYR
jgi:hypothetical protein